MATLLKTTFFASGLASLLVSCATPKATPVATPPPVALKAVENPEPSVALPPEPVFPGVPDDGIRMPDMLGMPSDGDFKPTASTIKDPSTGGGPVISRPPMEPPERVKPKPETKP
jgi:hypothetical protein